MLDGIWGFMLLYIMFFSLEFIQVVVSVSIGQIDSGWVIRIRFGDWVCERKGRGGRFFRLGFGVRYIVLFCFEMLYGILGNSNFIFKDIYVCFRIILIFIEGKRMIKKLVK